MLAQVLTFDLSNEYPTIHCLLLATTSLGGSIDKLIVCNPAGFLVFVCVHCLIIDIHCFIPSYLF